MDHDQVFQLLYEIQAGLAAAFVTGEHTSSVAFFTAQIVFHAMAGRANSLRPMAGTPACLALSKEAGFPLSAAGRTVSPLALADLAILPTDASRSVTKRTGRCVCSYDPEAIARRALTWTFQTRVDS